METLTVVKVEVTVITQEADPVTMTPKGKKTKTETETTTDKIDLDKTIKTKTTAFPNGDTTPANKSDEEKMRHTRLTLTMKAMMDKTLTIHTKAMTMPLSKSFSLPMKSFMTQTRPMMRKNMTNLLKVQADDKL
jgi:phosphate-selective porin